MSAVTVTLPAELEARAGASDQDRTAWLLNRAQGATATEVRDLWLLAHGYSAYTSQQKLIEEKCALLLAADGDALEAAAAATLLTAPVILWGKEREPVIAEQLRVSHGMLPESRVFRSAENPRHLASPDGVRVNDAGELEVSEIKTAGMDVSVGSEAYRKKGYAIQQQWVMGVLGAKRSLYAWELREGRAGEFESGHPFGVDVEWVEFDADLFAELVVLADHFLERLDAALAAARAGEGPVIDEELDTLALNYLRGLELEKEAKALKQASWDAIFERIDAGEEFVQESSLARVSFSPAVVEEKAVFGIDRAAAEAARPAGLYERLEQAEDDFDQAQEALKRERLAVDAFEAQFVRQTGVEQVVVKNAGRAVRAAKGTKQMKEKAA